MNIVCPKCQSKYNYREELRGERAECPHCKLQFTAMPSAPFSIPALPVPFPIVIGAVANRSLFGIGTDVAAELFRGLHWARGFCLFLLICLTASLWTGVCMKWDYGKTKVYINGRAKAVSRIQELGVNKDVHRAMKDIHDRGCVSKTQPSGVRHNDFDIEMAESIVSIALHAVAAAVEQKPPERALNDDPALTDGINEPLGKEIDRQKFDGTEKTTLTHDLSNLLASEFAGKAKVILHEEKKNVQSQLSMIALARIGGGVGCQILLTLFVLLQWIVMRFIGNYMIEHLVLLREISRQQEKEGGRQG